MNWQGCFTAIVTPFRDGHVDERAMGDLVAWQFANGVSGIVAAGTTGEGFNLTDAELERVLAVCVSAAKGKGPVIAGTGTHSTAHSIELTRLAHRIGCDAALVVTPYYCRPPQRGLLAHYRAVASASPLPVILYNVPSRTAVNLEPETAIEASHIPGVVGVKEAGGNFEAVAKIVAGTPSTFSVLSGDDSATYPMMALGAKGVISVASNVAPKEVSELTLAALRGDMVRARDLHFRLLPLMKGLFVEANPIPVKAALAIMGRIAPEIRLPLVELATEKRLGLETLLRDLALLREPAVAR